MKTNDKQSYEVRAQYQKKTDRPVFSVRISRELISQLKAVCYEAGEIEQSIAIERILAYLLKPASIETTKAIISSG